MLTYLLLRANTKIIQKKEPIRICPHPYGVGDLWLL